MVLVVCIVAIIRRAVFKPARYAHAPGQGHESEAYIILGLVSGLMLTDMVFDGSALKAAAEPVMRCCTPVPLWRPCSCRPKVRIPWTCCT